MKCLFGSYQKDEGKIFHQWQGDQFFRPERRAGKRNCNGDQELNQCLERSVIDNLFLGRYRSTLWAVVDEGQMKKKQPIWFRKLGMMSSDPAHAQYVGFAAADV